MNARLLEGHKDLAAAWTLRSAGMLLERKRNRQLRCGKSVNHPEHH